MCDDREDLLANLARFSPFYDWDYRNFRADIPLLKQLARDTDGPILEAGCGTGRVLMALATDARCTGIDICPEMLELARHNLATVPPAHQPLLQRPPDLRRNPRPPRVQHHQALPQRVTAASGVTPDNLA